MSFATGQDVMEVVEHLVRRTYSSISQQFVFKRTTVDDEFVPAPRTSGGSAEAEEEDFSPLGAEGFPRMAYDEVMSRFGSDKPDLRIPGEVGGQNKIFRLTINE
ncbi:MAG: hypothetical protein OK454_04055 [Thaumarchaeota archaeon]|nr:hypothetical protein [Nitrososphaerota archaeon]